MARVKTHPKPEPVKLSPKAVDAIAPGACLDVDLGEHDDPVALLAAYDGIGSRIEYVRMLLSGELTEAWAVLRAKKELRKEWDYIAEVIGAETLYMAEDSPDRRRERKKEIKRLSKQARRLHDAIDDCDRFWKASREYDDDQEAAQRLGLIAEGGQS